MQSIPAPTIHAVEPPPRAPPARIPWTLHRQKQLRNHDIGTCPGIRNGEPAPGAERRRLTRLHALRKTRSSSGRLRSPRQIGCSELFIQHNASMGRSGSGTRRARHGPVRISSPSEECRVRGSGIRQSRAATVDSEFERIRRKTCSRSWCLAGRMPACPDWQEIPLKRYRSEKRTMKAESLG